MLTHVAEEGPVGDVTVAARGDPWGPAALELSQRIGDADEAIVYLDGELDIASAEQAVSYVRDVIDHRRGPVIVNLAALAFCDARGLSALVRMARYAEQSDCPFQVTSPSPSLVKIMRITGLNRRFLASQPPAQPIDSSAQHAESAFGAHPGHG
jgi:anti-sigma B factor antagonist